jgi:hypothetical protein
MENVGYHSLPKEIVGEIVSHMAPLERLRSARVCRLWRDLAYDPTFWESYVVPTYPKEVEKLSIALKGDKINFRLLFAYVCRLCTDSVLSLFLTVQADHLRP